MARIEKFLCDKCGAEFAPDQVRLELSARPFLPTSGDTETEKEINAALNGVNDFCSLKCLYDWASARLHKI